MAARDITLSIVSHAQNRLVNQLLEDVQRTCAERVALLLTENAPDATPLALAALTCPAERIANAAAKGFGANHNAAFQRCRTPYFCVANPDIRLRADPFPALAAQLADPGVGVVGPLVRDKAGRAEDSARRFPTVGRLLARRLRARSGPDYAYERGALEVDWLAGMFLLFRSETYRAIGGFDERYFLYYEDVDICRRLAGRGLKAVYEPRAEVVHDARRASRRNLRLAWHHAASTLRFLRSRNSS